MQRGTHGRGLFGTFERERKCDHSLDLQGRCKYDIEDHGRSGTESFPTFTVVLGCGDLWTDLFAGSSERKAIRVARWPDSAVLVAAVSLFLRRGQFIEFTDKSEWHASWYIRAYGHGDLGIPDSVHLTHIGSAIGSWEQRLDRVGQFSMSAVDYSQQLSCIMLSVATWKCDS
jgi:hypothetical protein